MTRFERIITLIFFVDDECHDHFFLNSGNCKKKLQKKLGLKEDKKIS
jgi:hypothetical protein